MLHEGDPQTPRITVFGDDLAVAKGLEGSVILRRRLGRRAPEAGDIGVFSIRLAFAVDELAKDNVTRNNRTLRRFLQHALVKAIGHRFVSEVDGSAGEELDEVGPAGGLVLDPLDAALSPEAGVEARTAIGITGI